ncbi:integrase family protein [Pseudomonas sp. PH1b]|uniref:integrase family protein n=1 Tax=Pseudomonas sp. PH1b TaxID=1397282 RepID=UPI0009DDBC27|nr:integrase family protein [Pseudomonas sp. PH1b]
MRELNPKQVEHLTEPGRYSDDDGLYLVIKAGGNKSWLLRYQLNGKRRDMGLGPYPAVKLKTARQAVALLQSIPRIAGSPYLFPGSGSKSGVMHIGATFNLLCSMGLPDITTHGFRATFRTRAIECTDYPREVCKFVLAHDERDQTKAAYSRSNLLEKRRDLMQA